MVVIWEPVEELSSPDRLCRKAFEMIFRRKKSRSGSGEDQVGYIHTVFPESYEFPSTGEIGSLVR